MQAAGSEPGCAGLSYRLILLSHTATDPDGPDHLIAAFQRNAARENHDTAVIRNMNAEELVSGLAVLGQIFGRDIERARGPRLVDRDIDAPDPRLIHANVRDKIAAGIDYGDVHGLADFFGLFLGGRNDSACVLKGNHRFSICCD
jgi:hypothetical protein